MVGAVASGVFILPFFLFSAMGGEIADKFEKASIVRWIKRVEIIIMLVAVVGFLNASAWLLFASLFLMGVHSSFFGPIKYSILPQLLREDDLVSANALVEMGTFLAILLGSMLGGVLIGFKHGEEMVSGGLLGVAVLGFLFSKKIVAAPPGDPYLKLNLNVFSSIYKVLKEAKRDISVFWSIIAISWFWFYGAVFLSLFAGYTKDVLSADQNVGVFFLGLFSIGIGIGSMLCGRLSRGHLELGFVPLGSLGMSLFAADLFWVGRPNVASRALMPLSRFLEILVHYRIIFDLLFIAISAGFFIVPLFTLVQLRTADAERSRVIAGNSLWNSAFMVVASLAVMLSLKRGFQVYEIFLAIAVLNFLVTGIVYLIIPEFFFRLLAWMLTSLLYRLSARGVEKIPRSGPVLLVCNHVSFVDWLFISAAIRRPIRFVMTERYSNIPLVRRILHRAKVISIGTHANPKKLQESFDQIAFELERGSIVGIFPEGRLTKDGELQNFRKGVERILNRHPVSVYPMALRNLYGSLFSLAPKEQKILPGKFRAQIELVVGDALSPIEATSEALQTRVAELLKS